MTKKSMARTLIYLIELVIFNICAFLLVSKHNDVFWLTYAFTTIAFLSQIVFGILFDKKNLNYKFLSLPIFYINAIYLVVQLIACLICFIIPVSNVFAFIIQILILAINAVVILISIMGKENISNVGNEIEKNTKNIQMLTMESELLFTSQEDINKKRELKKLYEAIRYSDPVSSTESIRLVDEEINNLLQKIKDNVTSMSSGDLAKEIEPILELIAKRNMICKSSK